jgi:ribonuclease BN (tRNA processing enzyme)
MKRQGVAPSSIRNILITHLHGDHFGGLPFFILDAQFSKREAPLLIAGPPGIANRVQSAMEVLFPGSSETKQKFALEFREVTPGRPAELGTARVTVAEVVHFCGAPPLAVRMELQGCAIVYSGDTEWTDSLIALCRRSDLFICEACFLEKKVKFHMDYGSLGSHRSELGCKRLVLTHMSEDMLAYAQALGVECAHDGKTISL